MDILPTVASLAGGKLPAHAINGKDVWPLLAGTAGAKSPHEAIYYYYEGELRAIRSGRWKLQLPHTDKQAPDPDNVGRGGARGAVRTEQHPLALYDLEADPQESKDVASKHPDVVRRLEWFAVTARRELGDEIRGIRGASVRAAGRS